MHWHVTPRLFEIEWVQVKMEMAVAPGMVAPLDGTPDDQGVNGTSEGGKKNKSGGPRRKVGRWSEEETNTLIMLTNQVTHLLESNFPDSCTTWELLCVKSARTQCVQFMHNHASICRQSVKATLIMVLLAVFSLLSSTKPHSIRPSSNVLHV